MARRFAPLLAALLILATGCGSRGHAGKIPTEAAARAFLDRLVARAQVHDLAGYCRLAGSMCDDFAEEMGGVAAIPPNPPVIAGTRVIPTRPSGDAMRAGGQLLVLCGVDGLGRPYRTEMLVSTDFNGALYAINGIYWSGSGLALSGSTSDPSGGQGIACPGS